MTSVAERHNQLIEYLTQGKFAEGIEDFYHTDVATQENSEEPAVGREAIAENERQFLQKVTAYHGITVHATAITDEGEGTGTVLYEATMSWDQSDRPHKVDVNQAVVERWRNGRIASIRFYGNFDPGGAPE
jgi:hypothetical protein